MVNGSTKQFEVSWNETNKRIDLTTNKAYTVVGGEMALPSSAVKTAKESKASVFKDGNRLITQDTTSPITTITSCVIFVRI